MAVALVCQNYLAGASLSGRVAIALVRALSKIDPCTIFAGFAFVPDYGLPGASRRLQPSVEPLETNCLLCVR